MNDDQLIDHALKEHARHQGEPDVEFLHELEKKMEKSVAEEVLSKRSRKSGSSRKRFLMSMAAMLMIAVTLGVLYQYEVRRGEELTVESSVTYHPAEVVVPEMEAPNAPRLATRVERKGSAPADPAASIIATVNGPIAIPVPEGFGDIAYDTLSHQQPDFGSGFGDGDVRRGIFGYVPREGASGNKYGVLIKQGFLSPLKAPLSTFSVDVDTASYTNIRRLVESGSRVDPNGVRIEEMINYFEYQYLKPSGEHPFAVQSEVADCPWNAGHRLVKIALKGKDVKAERKAANLVFLVDVSGSMSSADKLPLLVKSFEILLKSLNEGDRVSLVVYAGRQAVLLKPTAIDKEGRQAVSGALRKLTAGGGTNGAAGISTAYDLARSGFIEGGVNRVILATDGDFNVGTTNQSELLKLVKNQAEGKISLTILGFGQGNLNDDLMEELTNEGDGNYFYLDSLQEGQKVFGTKLAGTLETIAKDVKIQVEFNPGKVSQYRLIGYANRRLKDEDFRNDRVDAGDIGAGHTVTALYEVVPVGAAQVVSDDLKYQKPVEEAPRREIVDSPELLTVKLRYKQPDGETSTELSEALTDEGQLMAASSDDFRFASSVALWGMLLSDSLHAGEGTIDMVEKLALDGLGKDEKGERAEFLDLVRKWQQGL